MAEPRRETLELMPEWTALLMYALFAVVSIIFLYGFWRKWRTWRRGQKDPILDRPRERLERLLRYALLQTRTAKKRYAGPMHLMIFWGFIFLFIGTVLVAIDYDFTQPLFRWQFLKGPFYLGFEIVLDAAGLAFLVGIGMAILRRLTFRPRSLGSTWQDIYVLGTFLFLGVSGFILEAVRLAIRDPEWEKWSFVAYLMKPAFDGLAEATQRTFYFGLWWSHALVTFLFIAMIPFTKLQHIFVSPANIFFGTPFTVDRQPKGELPTPFNLQDVLSGTASADSIRMGAKKLEDLSWKQLLSLDACTECGRCEDACPATAAGRPLSPMRLILDLRDNLHETSKGWDPLRAPKPVPEDVNLLAGPVIKEETLWSCVTCRACMEACPVVIEHVPIIVELRRGLVAESRIDKHKSNLLQNLANSGNAYGFPNSDRAKWAEGLDVPVVGENGQTASDIEVLYWVGCSGSFDPRNQKVSQAFAKVMKAAGVRFAILGSQERCNGDPARRLGEEGRYQEMVLANIETFKQHNIRKVVAQCPHCFNTLKHEYKRFGWELDVVHHSQFIGDLIKNGRLKPTQHVRDAMTYHDSCYLGRYNDVYDAPREILQSVGTDVREMPRNRSNSFCCGGGGSNMWFEVKEEKERISQIRLKEAVGTGAKVVATACPFCMTMLDDAAKLAGKDDTKVQDIVEILANGLGPPAS